MKQNQKRSKGRSSNQALRERGLPGFWSYTGAYKLQWCGEGQDTWSPTEAQKRDSPIEKLGGAQLHTSGSAGVCPNHTCLPGPWEGLLLVVNY